MAARIGLLALAVSLACLGAQAGPEPTPIAESVVDERDPTREGDAEAEGGSSLPRQDEGHTASPWEADAGPGDGPAVTLDAPAVLVSTRFAPWSALTLASRPGAHARIAQLLVSSVPTRGPTLLG